MSDRARQGEVDGVQVWPLHQVNNERGHLLEIARDDDEWFPDFGQVYATTTFPGVVKAWYRHRHQTDTITVVQGSILLALFDDRSGSPTAGAVQSVQLGVTSPVCVVIPPLVWHGFRADEPDAAIAVHVNSHPFRHDGPDEERRGVDDPSMPALFRSPG